MWSMSHQHSPTRAVNTNLCRGNAGFDYLNIVPAAVVVLAAWDNDPVVPDAMMVAPAAMNISAVVDEKLTLQFSMLMRLDSALMHFICLSLLDMC